MHSPEFLYGFYDITYEYYLLQIPASIADPAQRNRRSIKLVRKSPFRPLLHWALFMFVVIVKVLFIFRHERKQIHFAKKKIPNKFRRLLENP